MSDARGWYRIGHTTYADDCTGCTAIVFELLVPAVVDVRGGAPGTRETELLQPGRQVGGADAIVLTGSSAFGLAAADGVVRWLAERNRGFPTRVGPVPIVPAAVVYDLATGAPRLLTPEDGYAAADAAAFDTRVTGQVGAGAGATVAKFGGKPTRGGLGMATVRLSDREVTAVVVVNALGDIRDPDTGEWLAVADDPEGLGRRGRELALAARLTVRAAEHTSIGAVLVSGSASRDALVRCCIAAHDGLARCVVPAHTLYDGDTFFAAAEREGASSSTEIVRLAAAAELAVERAIVGLFRTQSGTR